MDSATRPKNVDTWGVGGAAVHASGLAEPVVVAFLLNTRIVGFRLQGLRIPAALERI